MCPIQDGQLFHHTLRTGMLIRPALSFRINRSQLATGQFSQIAPPVSRKTTRTSAGADALAEIVT
jgi:hypothetical protein